MSVLDSMNTDGLLHVFLDSRTTIDQLRFFEMVGLNQYTKNPLFDSAKVLFESGDWTYTSRVFSV